MSDRALARAMLVLALAGAAIAGYLTWVHYAGIEPFCAGGGGACERVQTSRYAELGGVPVALLGLVGYLAIAGALTLAPASAARPAVAFLALAGTGFSAYLTYLELFEIDAICQWCVASAIVMGLLAVLAVTRLLRVDV
jgi:uncharacterized membrane protein